MAQSVPFLMGHTQNRIMQEITVLKVEKYFQLTYTFLA